MAGFRRAGLNFWIDKNESLGGLADPFHHGCAVGLIAFVSRNRGYGIGLRPSRDDPTFYLFIGTRHIGIDRFPEGYG